MPRSLKNAKVLIIDDTLAPEEIVGDALHTEIGFQEQLKLEKLFRENLDKIISLGVNLVIVDRGITDLKKFYHGRDVVYKGIHKNGGVPICRC